MGDKHLYEFGPFSLDPAERRLLRDGQSVALTPKCFDLLVVLVENSGHLLEKDALLERLWRGQIVEEANLSFNISSLRKALGEGQNGQRFIETVPKKGFRFVAKVEGRRSARPSLTEDAIDETALEEDFSKSVFPPQSTPSADVRLNLKILIGITAAGVLALAIIAYGIWIGKSKAEPPPLRVVPFTSYEGNETQPAFSPDGRYIAFVWKGERGDNVDIYVKPVDGGTPLRLTTDPARDSSPAWSPDGRHVAFARRSNEANGIYEVDLPAGPERKVADFRPGASFLLGRCLDWSPDGKTLAIAERVGKSNSHAIFLVSVETGEERQLTTPEAEDTGDVEPAFSRDGRLLAFVRESHYLVREIYVIPAAGGEPRRITFDNKKVLAIAWTVDGRELVFSSDPNGNFTLRRIPVAGGEAVPLAGTSGFSSGWGNHIDDLSISRHANRIVYTQWFQDVNTYRIDAARSSAQRYARSLQCNDAMGVKHTVLAGWEKHRLRFRPIR